MSCHTVTQREVEALSVICGKYTRWMREHGAAFEDLKADIVSARWLNAQLGLSHPEQGARCLRNLCAARLLWKSPYSKRLTDGYRPCHMYRPTYAGMALAGARA